MNVIEIFDSIDGEGIFSGCLATFIRLAGCNLRCSYCDTRYSFSAENGCKMSVEEIVSKCKEIGNRHVTLTGGEPLASADVGYLISDLLAAGFIVNIETNGSLYVAGYQVENTIITMDYKTISSGENDKMSKIRIESLRDCDVLKIVCVESDFEDIERMLTECNVKATVFLSPIFGKVEPEKLVDFAKHLRNDGLIDERARVQLQLHKLIWNPDKRGV